MKSWIWGDKYVITPLVVASTLGVLMQIGPFLNRSRFIISFPKRSRRNYIPINTLYREVDCCYVLINKSLLERFSLLFCLLA